MREKRRATVGVALVASLVGLALVNTHPLWRPLTSGVVTDAFSRVVPAADVALIAHVIGNGLLLRTTDPVRFRRGGALADVVFAATGLAALVALLNVFPFDVLAVGQPEAESGLRTAIGVLVFAAVIALVLALLRGAGAALGDGTPAAEAHHAEPEPHAEPKKRPTPMRPPPPRSRKHR